MIVIINGSFGIGKTTVAKLLRHAFPGSLIYDPEWAGLFLMRLPKWMKLKGAGTDDFQDIVLWRKLTIKGIKLFRFLASGKVIVPMTFSRRDYLDEVLAGIRPFDPDVSLFCLKASLPTVEQRLAGRGTDIEGQGSAWIARRINECAAAHRDAHFGEPVETEARTAREVAADIVRRLRHASRQP